jgi:hypothetical protein
MPKTYQVTLSDELRAWIEEEARLRSLRPSTTIAYLVGEAKRNKVNQSNLQIMFDKIKDLKSDDLTRLMTLDIKKELPEVLS